MRKYQLSDKRKDIRLLTLDDDMNMTVTIQSYFQSLGYEVDVETDPLKAIEKIKTTHYDILLLDFLMTPICGDKVVEAVREFNGDIFIILLTGHKSMAPPVRTIRELNIQGYFEKSNNFNQLELLVESCVKSIYHLHTIREYRDSLEDTNKKLVEANEMLRFHYQEMATIMRSMVDARDIYTRGHSDRVSFLAEKISRALNRSEEDHERIKSIGLFHDIGKLKVPDSILLKDGIIDQHERMIIQEHPQNAYNILSNVTKFTDILPGVLHHHERFDGSGYPHGLIGLNICEDARIISVADAFDAMTSYRRYRVNLSAEQAAQELINGKGTHFDPNITDVFIKMLETFETMKNDPAWVDPILDAMKASGGILQAYD